MEQRFKFEFFSDETYHHSSPELETFYLEKGDDFFIGKELVVNDVKIIYYIFITGKNCGLLMLYLSDDAFDGITENINEYNAQGMCNAWPQLMKALSCGRDDNYFETAIIKLNTDNFGTFWTSCRSIENVNLQDLDTEYVIEKLSELYSNTIDILTEYRDNDISAYDQVKAVGKGAYSGYKKGKIISTALGIGGLLLGIPGLEDLLDD